MSATNSPSQLVDRFGRTVSYIRLSVTDRCDLRCVYCMPEKMKFVPRTQLLTLEEMESVARTFIRLGVDKIRITGGEPLVRRNIMQLFNNLGEIEAAKAALSAVLEEIPGLTLSKLGVLKCFRYPEVAARLADGWRAAGLPE